LKLSPAPIVSTGSTIGGLPRCAGRLVPRRLRAAAFDHDQGNNAGKSIEGVLEGGFSVIRLIWSSLGKRMSI
jgi:hypothetical protein